MQVTPKLRADNCISQGGLTINPGSTSHGSQCQAGTHQQGERGSLDHTLGGTHGMA
jgi:hypothetical protein